MQALTLNQSSFGRSQWGPKMSRCSKGKRYCCQCQFVLVFLIEDFTMRSAASTKRTSARSNASSKSKVAARHSAVTSDALEKEMPRVVALYSDGGPDSQKAEQMLRRLNLELDIVKVRSETDEVVPTAVFRAWCYRGLAKIDILRRQVESMELSGIGSK